MKQIFSTVFVLAFTFPAVAQPSLPDQIAELEKVVAELRSFNKDVKDSLDDLRYKQSIQTQTLAGIKKQLDSLTNTSAVLDPPANPPVKKMVANCPGCSCGCVTTGLCVCNSMFKFPQAISDLHSFQQAQAYTDRTGVKLYSSDGCFTWTTTPTQANLYSLPENYGGAAGFDQGGFSPRFRLFGGLRGASSCGPGGCR